MKSLETGAAGSQTTVQVSNLTIGRRLRFPIYDGTGLLLLAADSEITAHFKELLLARGLREVVLSPTDAAGMPGIHRSSGLPLGNVRFDSSVGNLLETLVDSGRLFKEDTGSKFKDRLIQHGIRSFSKDQQEAIVRKHSETCSRLDQMIKSAAREETLQAEDVANVVSDYLLHLMADSDCMVDLMARTRAYTGVAQHCLQMSVLGMAMAIEAEMSETDVRLVGLCGLVHDWGMTHVPEHLRNANRVLNQVEFLEIQKHPIYTLDMLRKINGIPSQVPMVCYQVHERPDGRGYPRGRRGGNIHPCARILNVADAYSALVTPRPFRKALEPYIALDYLIRQASDMAVDATAVRSLLHVLSQFPIGSIVVLSDWRKARVLRRNGANYSSPIVQILEEADGTPADPLAEANVLDPSANYLRITQVVPTEGCEDVETSLQTVDLKRE